MFFPSMVLCVSFICGSPEAEPKLSEWTILVFMNADNNLEPFGIQDFQEMAQVGSTDTVQIIVQMDRTPGYSKEYGDWTQTLRFRVIKGMEPTVGNALEDIGEVNMGDGRELAAFVAWGKEKFPAKHYVLVIWDHGQGWRFKEKTRYRVATAIKPLVGKGADLTAQHAFRSRLLEVAKETPKRFDEKENWASIDKDERVAGAIKYISSDETSSSHLYNRDMQDSLEKVLGPNKLEIIGFDACLMAMIETAYAVRNAAKVMVGSEEVEPGNGWQYKLWLEKLVANPGMSEKELGSVIVESYKICYEIGFSDTTLSAINLMEIDNLSTLVSHLGDACRMHLNLELSAIKTARSECRSYAPGYGLQGIDLGLFCEKLQEKTNDETIKSNAKSVRDCIDKLMVKNYAGTSRQEKFGSRGIAIYFPESYNAYLFDEDGPAYSENNKLYPVQFIQDHTWDNFLNEYFKEVPQ